MITTLPTPGPAECAANLLEMCVIKYVPDWKQYWPMLACFENSVSLLRPRKTQINISAWVFCTSWCAKFEFQASILPARLPFPLCARFFAPSLLCNLALGAIPASALPR